VLTSHSLRDVSATGRQLALDFLDGRRLVPLTKYLEEPDEEGIARRILRQGMTGLAVGHPHLDSVTIRQCGQCLLGEARRFSVSARRSMIGTAHNSPMVRDVSVWYASTKWLRWSSSGELSV
jgi:hypothetical protein